MRRLSRAPDWGRGAQFGGRSDDFWRRLRRSPPLPSPAHAAETRGGSNFRGFNPFRRRVIVDLPCDPNFVGGGHFGGGSDPFQKRLPGPPPRAPESCVGSHIRGCFDPFRCRRRSAGCTKSIVWNSEDLIPPSEKFIFNVNSKDELKKVALVFDSIRIPIEYGDNGSLSSFCCKNMNNCSVE